MAEASRDQNRVTTLLAVSNADGVTPVTLYADPTTHRLLVSPSGGSGDVTGPGASTDNAVVRWDGTAGTSVQDSGVIIDNSDNVTGMATLTLPNTGLHLLDTNASHDLIIAPGSDLSADHTLTITTGDADRTLTLAGNATISGTTSGTNTGDVTLAGTPDYITISGQVITRGAIDVATDITGVVPVANGGTNASSAGITAFNNITGYTASGATGTTSTNLVFSTSPSLTTPSLGDATATTINKVTITAPATGSTLTIDDGASLITSGGDSITLTSTAATNVTLPTTGTLATLAGTEELDNKTLDSSVGKGTWTASGTWTLPAYTAGGNITLAENTGVVYDAALSADGTYSGMVRAGTAGATLAFGDLIYLSAADSRWELADADAAATSGDVMLGMCVLAAANDGDPTTVLLQGFIRADTAFPALTIGGPAYVGTTPGDIQTAQPSGTDDVIRRVGFAWTADELLFNPSNDYVTHI